MVDSDDTVPALESDRTAASATALESDRTVWAPPALDSDPALRAVALRPQLAGEARYISEASLGEGGMGEVRLCRDGVIGRRVAMKVMRADCMHDAALRTRFLREARVQGQLEHPAIVPVYDMGRDASGAEYFTMKRIRGRTLDDWIQALRDGTASEREHPLHRLLSAFCQVCLAVHFAHERGVVHRDLKPSNIMLGDFGEVHVLDWGVAKIDGDTDPIAEGIALDAESSGKATAYGTMLGTPAYAAPEQVRGEAIDRRADVWSLGAILFEILTLEPLNPLGDPIEMMTRTATGALDAHATRRAPARNVAPELEAICVRATASDPRKRFRDARALERAVDAYLAGDRDQAMRRTLAEAHVVAAKRATPQESLHELGRAIAFDPQNEEAVRLLLEQLTRPPPEPPPEVVRELDALKEADAARAMPIGAFGYGLPPLALFLPLAFWMGTRSLPAVLACASPFVIAGILGYVAHRRHRLTAVMPIVAVLGAIGVSCASVLLGPFIFVPALATLNGAVFCFMAERKLRTPIILMNCLAVLAPFALELAGIVPAVHSFDPDGTMRIRSFGVLLPRAPTLALLCASSLFAIGVGGAFVASFARRIEAALLARLTQTWQIRQLLPAPARDRTTTMPPPKQPGRDD